MRRGNIAKEPIGKLKELSECHPMLNRDIFKDMGGLDTDEAARQGGHSP